ncbi:MAG: DUF2723 domain-containing protein [Gemmatimonadetes bacterium]|nr:DUF2723 domain-containing protein [Gemmatimonadota bacterium]
MTDRADSPAARPNPGASRAVYFSAAGVFLTVLAGYVWTLAPTVTFWDAGEFIAAARILGIPHPPGTPLFVLLGHVWAEIVRIGEFAYRTNLMSATFSAAGSACFFLLVARTLSGQDPVFRYGGGAAAAILSAFAFTVWQNSNETEVYSVATFSIAAICWLGFVWRGARGTERAPHILLLCVYLGAVSLGNHLLTLLVGPALIGFVWHVLRTAPLADERDRRAEWAQWAVVTGMWALLIGTGLGKTWLLVLGGLLFVAAGMYAAMAGSLGFALSVLAVGAVGASTYLFLYVRAGQHPFINEVDPSTWDALKAVIRREQYPARSPFDDPTELSGPDNPGRSLSLMWWQAVNYLQYFDWQWANGLAPTQPVFAPARVPFTLAFVSLGVYGADALRRRDRSVFWLLLLLFLTTGPALVGYMNFKPGYSLLWDVYPSGDQHEVRERDYFFTVSFQVWGLFAGLGLAGVYRAIRGWAGPHAAVRAAPAVLAAAFLPFALNFRAASRAHGPDATLARDFAYDLLQSVDPYGVIFVNGDNDTFPLWYMQETEDFRQDVAVINLSLASTDWFIRQMRDNPVRPFVPSQAPWLTSRAPSTPPPPLHSLTDQEIRNLVPQLLSADYIFRVGRIEQTYRAGTPFYPNQVITLRVLQESRGRRPVVFSTTAGTGSWMGLGRHLTQEGLVLRLNYDPPGDSTLLSQGLLGAKLDSPRTDTLAWSVYRYARLFEVDSLALEPTSRNIAANLALPFLSLGQAYAERGDQERSLRNFRRAYHLSPSPELRRLMESLSVGTETEPGGERKR